MGTNQGLYRFERGAFSPVIPDLQIYHVFEDHTGIRWFCTGWGLARQVGDALQRILPYEPHRTPEAYRVFEDPAGNKLVIMANGLFRVTATGLESVAPSLTVKQVVSDRDVDLWVGANDQDCFDSRIARSGCLQPPTACRIM